MGSQKLRGKDLDKIHIHSNDLKSLLIEQMTKLCKYQTKEEKLLLLLSIKENPTNYLEDEKLKEIACLFQDRGVVKEAKEEISLLPEAKEFTVYGRKHISSNAYLQMKQAMQLPIAEKGALMPDAHHGYGLPIGGVLATKNAVIPYGVGVDIGCRMSLSIFDIKSPYLKRYAYQLKHALKEKTCFGTGGELMIRQEHEVLDSKVFSETALLRQLHSKAARQLGTSGSGNHFVEFGEVTLAENNDFGLPQGEYVGLLAHSGSRGLGATIANHYTQMAKEQCLLPTKVQHLAWLDLATELGQEYWLSMNLAGEYAKACHDQIHYHLSQHLGIKAIVKVENHHNFAWKEKRITGEELIVHRKGATPAAAGELGIIPGSMANDGYIVRGKGQVESLLSASHGAGRKMSRSKARQSYTNSQLKKVLSQKGVTLIGGGVDEAPVAYKDLEQVMMSQEQLVDVVGKFTPKIVRMDKK